MNRWAIDGQRAIVSGLASKCRHTRIEELLTKYQQDQWSREALQGLLDIQAPQVDHLLQRVLRGQPSGTMSTALEAVAARNGLAWCPEVYRLFSRLSPHRDIPEPYLWVISARFLLSFGYRAEEVIAVLLKAQDRESGEAALLALEFAPSHALTLFQRALRSSVPLDRTFAAAVLAILDEPWCVREMVNVLKGSSDREFTASLRGALVCSCDPSAHVAVLAWEEQHPLQPHGGLGYTWEEVAEAHRDSWVQNEMAKLHDRVLPLRGRVID